MKLTICCDYKLIFNACICFVLEKKLPRYGRYIYIVLDILNFRLIYKLRNQTSMLVMVFIFYSK